MYLTATATSFLLLQNDVSHLWDAFNWVVAGIGVIMTMVILAITYIQYSFSKKIVKEEIENIKNEISVNLTKKSDEDAMKINSFVKETIDRFRIEFREQKKTMEGGISRIYAITASDKNLNATAFGWWLQAAFNYDGNDITLFNVSVSSMLASFDKIDKSSSSERSVLLDNMTNNTNTLDIIKKNHPTEASIILEKMKEKCM